MKNTGNPEIVGTTPGSESTARSGSPNAPGSSRACARESDGVAGPRGVRVARTSTSTGGALEPASPLASGVSGVSGASGASGPGSAAGGVGGNAATARFATLSARDQLDSGPYYRVGIDVDYDTLYHVGARRLDDAEPTFHVYGTDAQKGCAISPNTGTWLWSKPSKAPFRLVPYQENADQNGRGTL